MDLKQLRSLVYVAELGSFTKASAFLHITQPALSRQIRMLEEELGAKLFHRNGQGISLTTDGTILLAHSTALVNQVEGIKREFKARLSTSNATGVVGIGLPAPASRFLSATFLDQVARSCPGVSLRIVEGFSSLIHEWLLSGSIEMAILYGTQKSQVAESKLLAIESLCAIGQATPHNLQRESITLAELVRQPLVLCHRPHTIRDLLDAAGFAPQHVVTEVDAQSLLIDMARSGRAFTILPRSSVQDAVDAGQVVVLPIVQPSLSWRVKLCYSALKPLSPAAQTVITLIEGEVRRMIHSGEWQDARLPTPSETD